MTRKVGARAGGRNFVGKVSRCLVSCCCCRRGGGIAEVLWLLQEGEGVAEVQCICCRMERALPCSRSTIIGGRRGRGPTELLTEMQAAGIMMLKGVVDDEVQRCSCRRGRRVRVTWQERFSGAGVHTLVSSQSTNLHCIQPADIRFLRATPSCELCFRART